MLKNFFRESGLDLAGKRLMSLSEDDLNQQVWTNQAPLASLTIAEEHNGTRPVQQPFSKGAGEERFYEEARKVGRRLYDIAVFGRDDASWLGITLVNERYWSVLPLGPKLYDGISGIALFLAYLGSVTGEKKQERLARRAVLALRRELNEAIKTMPIGGFSGMGGIVYVLCHLAALWRDQALLDEAERVAGLMPPLIEKDDHLDLMGGAAGCILSLYSLHQLRPSPAVLSIMRQCGDHLLKKAQPIRKGVGWLVKAVAPEPLTGFSHGAAGIAWALWRLGTLTGEDHFREAALQGIAYEQSLFMPGEGNWPDLRRTTQTTMHCGTAWCHGAPGIGLARLKMMQSLNREDIRTEVEIALHTTLRQGFGTGHCLCHGDLGNLEFILEAGRVLDAPEWKQETARLAANILESIGSDGWLCGTPAHVQTPGLMTGLAGIGYQLLRLANPSKVPSVLCLEPPYSRR